MNQIVFYKHKIGILKITLEGEKISSVEIVKGSNIETTKDKDLPEVLKKVFLKNVPLSTDVIYKPTLTNLQLKVLDEVSKIPYGKTCTYSEIAEKVGNLKAVRAVAHAIAINPCPVIIPCHRVVRRDAVGEYIWGRDLKIELLKMEGAL